MQDETDQSAPGPEQAGSSHPPAGTSLGQSAAALAVLAVCALAVVHPLIVHGASCGHDFDFHLQSWLGVDTSWQAGMLAPHWLPGANYGAGEPRFLFYPPLSWLLGGLLGLVLPWILVPAMLTWIALFTAGCTARHFALRAMPAPAALAAGCLYLANPYLLFTAYERTAYGELLAAAWIPLVLLYTLVDRDRPVWLALTLAVLWLTNAPAAVMGCYLALVCSLLQRAPVRAWLGSLQAALGAIVLGTSLAGVYVFPAWYEQRWVQIARANAPGMRVDDSFLFGRTGEAFHDQVLRTASWLAVAILLAALAGAVVARRTRSGAPVGLPHRLIILCAAIFFFLLPVSAPLWHHLPELAFLQFPWRWLLVAGLAAATLVAIAMPLAWKLRWIALGMLFWCLGSSIWALHRFWQSCDDEDAIEAQLRLGDAGFAGTDEYTAGSADNGEIQQHLPLVRLLTTPDANEGDDTASPNPPWLPDLGHAVPGQFAIERWAPEQKRLLVIASAPAFAVLRLDAYPAWQVRLNGQPCGVRCAVGREDGLLTIRLPAGRTQIDVRFTTTGDVWAGRGLSLAAALVLIGVARRRKPALP